MRACKSALEELRKEKREGEEEEDEEEKEAEETTVEEGSLEIEKREGEAVGEATVAPLGNGTHVAVEEEEEEEEETSPSVGGWTEENWRGAPVEEGEEEGEDWRERTRKLAGATLAVARQS